MTSSGSAKTARPISPSSTSRRCAPFRTCRFSSLPIGRDGRVLAARARSAPFARDPGADAAEPAAPAPRSSSKRTLSARGGYELSPPRRRGGGLDLRHRLRSLASRSPLRSSLPRRRCRRGWSRCPAWSFSSRPAGDQSRRDHRPAEVQCRASRPASPRLGRDHRLDGAFIGMTGFGASAPYKELYEHFGITPEGWPMRPWLGYAA